MKIEFAFDDKKIKDNGFDEEKIYRILQEDFKIVKLPCIKNDNDSLVFEDNGTENDYANMFNIVFDYIKTDWFLKVATKCNFYENNDDEYYEDILQEIKKTNVRKNLGV